MALAKITLMTELVREDSLTIGWQWDWAFASSARFGWWQHRPPLLNYSLGNAIIRHKGLSFASALWKPGDINCRGSLPSPVLLPPVGVLDRPRSPHSAPPPTTICPLHPPGSLFHEPELRIFPVLRIPLSYGSVLCWQQSTPRFRPRVPYANSSHRRLLSNTLARGKHNPKRASKMFAGTGDVF